MLPRYKFYKLASHLIRQDTRSKEYEDVTLDRNKKRLKPHQIGNDSNLLIVFYVQIMPDDFVMQLHRF